MTTEIQLYDPAGTEARTTTIHQIETALAKLAAHGTRSQIAAHLESAGHLGNLGHGRTCPVFRYLDEAVPGLSWMSVTRDQYLVQFDFDDFWAVIHAGRLPEPVSAFVRRFDAEDYPTLIAPDSPSVF